MLDMDSDARDLINEIWLYVVLFSFNAQAECDTVRYP